MTDISSFLVAISKKVRIFATRYIGVKGTVFYL